MSQQLNRPASVGMHRIFASGDVASEQAVRQQGTKQTCRRSTISAITCLMHSIQPTSCNHCNYHSAPQTAQCKDFKKGLSGSHPFLVAALNKLKAARKAKKPAAPTSHLWTHQQLAISKYSIQAIIHWKTPGSAAWQIRRSCAKQNLSKESPS